MYYIQIHNVHFTYSFRKYLYTAITTNICLSTVQKYILHLIINVYNKYYKIFMVPTMLPLLWQIIRVYIYYIVTNLCINVYNNINISKHRCIKKRSLRINLVTWTIPLSVTDRGVTTLKLSANYFLFTHILFTSVCLDFVWKNIFKIQSPN